VYKIGTRGSLLAVTQCTLVKQQLEALTGESFELHLIKTQGDQVTDRPLWQLEGKDFFTKELDEALLAGTVDLVVHSYKDLGSERPAGLALAAVTERHFAHDVLLVPRAHVKRLVHWEGEFVVGTSSPRRVVNLTRDLPEFLPGRPQVRCETLRGNINTRIQKLKDGKYHAITLALAGVDRLAQLDTSRTELEALLEGLTFMVLPLGTFPAAAAQGALAIETRADRADLRKILSQLHHLPTAAAVAREREAFKGYGGGCHLAVGIHVRACEGDFLHFHRGEKDGVDIQVRRREGATPPVEKPGQVFLGQGRAVGLLSDTLYEKFPTNRMAPTRGRQVFVTTAHALPSYAGDATALWAAGAETHRKLAQAGHWVNGNADSLGHAELQRLDHSRALRIMTGGAPWLVLSHAKSESPLGEVFAAYEQRMLDVSAPQRQALSSVTHAWWASYPQYQAYVHAVPEMARARHYCGLGKTLTGFRAHGVTVEGLTDHHEFLKLMGKA
jgi:hydroxymethylbilane synthase